MLEKQSRKTVKVTIREMMTDLKSMISYVLFIYLKD